MTDVPPEIPQAERPRIKYKRVPKRAKRRRKVQRYLEATSIRVTTAELKALKRYARANDMSVSRLLRRIIAGWMQYQRFDIGKLDIPT